MGSQVKNAMRPLGAMLAALLIVAACSAPAAAASWLEKNFYLSGPRFDSQLPTCEQALSDHSEPLCHKGGTVLEFELANYGVRPHPRGGVPALGRRHHSPPILQRPGSHLRRPLANPTLFDHRGWRHDRLELGRAMVRRRSRPQLGLQPRLPSRRPLSSLQIRSNIWASAASPPHGVA